MPEMFENKAKFAANSRLLARTSTQLSDISGVRSEFMIRSELPKQIKSENNGRKDLKTVVIILMKTRMQVIDIFEFSGTAHVS